MTTRKKRMNRSVYLDREKVRTRAEELGITSLATFEIDYIRHSNIPETRSVNAPTKAWYGGKIQRKYANQIAEFLGFQSYVPLLFDSPLSPWSSLLQSEDYQSSFMDFSLEEKLDSKLIDLSEFYEDADDKLDRINVNKKWYLKLSGKSGHHFMIILQSENEIFQLAPINLENFISKVPKGEKELRFPAKKGITFSKESLGWRRCIVVRAPYIPLTMKSRDTGLNITSQELNTFALKLQQEKNLDIAIAQYEFLLVNE